MVTHKQNDTGRFLRHDFFEDADFWGIWEVNSEVKVESTMKGISFSTEFNDRMKPLMWYEISDPDEWIFSLTYQIDLVSDASGGYGGDDYDYEGFPIRMVVTTVKPSEANHIVWPEVNYLGFTSFTVVYDQTTSEDDHSSSSYITMNRYDFYEGYRTVKEYFGKGTTLREGIAVEAAPFLAPADHKGPLFVVVMGAGNATNHLKYVELGKTPMRSTMPVQYSCHARSHAIGDALPKLDCALGDGRNSQKQCSSAWKYDSTYEGDESGCMITAERGGSPWCVLATDENGFCRGGCKDEDEDVTWDYCVEPVEREKCLEFCGKIVGGISGEPCAGDWYPQHGDPLVPSCTTMQDRVPTGQSWCALIVSEQDSVCADVCSVIYFYCS